MRGVTSPLVKLIVFATVTALATGVLATTIANVRFESSHSYQAVFTDVTGLNEGDDVRIAGVRVGEVTGLRVKDRTLAEVAFSVDADRPLDKSTRAVIRYRNLVGQRYLALTEGPGAREPMPPGGTIPLDQTQPALDLTVLFNGFKPLFAALSPEDVNTLAFEIIQTLQGEGGTINSLLAHTASLTNTVADRDQVIGEVIDNLNAVLATVDRRDRQLDDLIVQLQRLVSGLSADRDAIGESLAGIDSLAAATADLVKEGRPAIQTDIEELREVMATLDDNKEVVDGVLKRLPDKLTQVTRTATYGSWFNFYLCDFTGQVVLPAELGTLEPSYHVAAGRCP